MNPKPRYTHDCDTCVFLGQYRDATAFSHKYTDLYYCASCDSGSVLARYGSKTPDYMSAPIAVLLYAGYKSEHPLLEAIRRQIRIWQGVQ